MKVRAYSKWSKPKGVCPSPGIEFLVLALEGLFASNVNVGLNFRFSARNKNTLTQGVPAQCPAVTSGPFFSQLSRKRTLFWMKFGLCWSGYSFWLVKLKLLIIKGKSNLDQNL